jgi:hypothetical protein
MALKFLAFAVLIASGLWLMGYGPEDLARAAVALSDSSASTISAESSDWG